MKICRLIFRKSTKTLLVKIMYGNEQQIPEVEQEVNDFAVLNGYNESALEVVDILETDPEFEKVVTAKTIRLENGSLVYTFAPIEPEPQPEPSPVAQLNDKVDLLIQMQLEREGII